MPSFAATSWSEYRRRSFMLGLAPALLILGAITIAPAIYLFLTSLTPLNLTAPHTAWDFSEPSINYVELWEDVRFRQSAWIQVKLSVATVFSQLLVGLGVALLLHGDSRLRQAVRTGFLVPMVLPPIVVAILWKVMFTIDVSPFHRAMAFLGMPLGSFITNADTALWAIVVVETWEWFPFTMIMVLAALQMIPDSPIEAARVDGATNWQLFRFVLLPFLRQTLIVAGLFRLIDSIKAFPLIYVLTNGGPGNATEVTNYYGFIQAFQYSYWGIASAVATLMVAAIFILSWIIDRLIGPARVDGE